MALCVCTAIVVFVMMLQGRSESFTIADDAATTTGGIYTKTMNTSKTRVISLNNESLVSQLLVLSKSLVVQRAYFDYRKRDGHENTVVFLLEI